MTGLREDREWRRKVGSEQVRVGRGLKREERGSEGPSVCKFTPHVSWVRYRGGGRGRDSGPSGYCGGDEEQAPVRQGSFQPTLQPGSGGENKSSLCWAIYF